MQLATITCNDQLKRSGNKWKARVILSYPRQAEKCVRRRKNLRNRSAFMYS
jgi:hypothetical protein